MPCVCFGFAHAYVMTLTLFYLSQLIQYYYSPTGRENGFFFVLWLISSDSDRRTLNTPYFRAVAELFYQKLEAVPFYRTIFILFINSTCSIYIRGQTWQVYENRHGATTSVRTACEITCLKWCDARIKCAGKQPRLPWATKQKEQQWGY